MDIALTHCITVLAIIASTTSFPMSKAFRNYQRSYLKRDAAEDHHLAIFRELKAQFLDTSDPTRVLYPGCHRHITPSLIFDDVTYVDQDMKVADVFQDDYTTNQWLDQHKEYDGTSKVQFTSSSYKSLGKHVAKESFDLLISLSAGIVSHDCVPFLKQGGIFFVNDSHSDAKMASLNPNLEVVAYLDDNEFVTDDLDLLFLAEPKQRGKKRILSKINAEQVDEAIRVGAKSKRSFVMKKEPMFYVFRKVQHEKQLLAAGFAS